MKSVIFFLLLIFVLEFGTQAFPFDHNRRRGGGRRRPSSSGKYRISPKTGLRIALPSKYPQIDILVC